MNFIWETVNKYVPENMADGVFLTTLIVGWCVLVFGVGMLFCVAAAGSASAGCIVNVMCMALYAAIIFGLFGGIFYLSAITDREPEAQDRFSTEVIKRS